MDRLRLAVSLQCRTRGGDKGSHTGGLDRVPPDAVHLERGGHNDTLGSRQDLRDIAWIDARSDQKRQMGGRRDRVDLLDRGTVARPLAGRNHRVGIEKGEIARQFLDGPVGGDRMGAMLHMGISEDSDVIGTQSRPVAQSLRGFALDQTLIRHIGIGPLVYPNEPRARRDRDRQGRNRGVGQDIDPEGYVEPRRETVGDHRDTGGRLRSDPLGLAERDIPMVLYDEAMQSALDQSFGIPQAILDDPGHRGTAVARRAGQGWNVDHPDQRLVPTENLAYRIGLLVGNQCHPLVSMLAHVIGNAAFDETFAVEDWPRPGASTLARAWAAGPGGKGLNQAVVLARAGIRTRLTAAIGTDARGAEIRRSLAGEPLETNLLTVADRATDLSIILIGEDRENCVITTTDCADALSPAEARAALSLAAPGDALILQGNLGHKTTVTALCEAGARGIVRVMNPSPLRPWQRELLPLCDLLFVNADEARALTGITGRGAIPALRATGVSTVVLTLGREGAILSGADAWLEVPALEVNATDTTGAGDVFLGTALAASFLRHASLDETALQAGIRAAALAVTRPGAFAALPTLGELSAILAS